MDAAVAAALCQGVVNPFASGLGGGHFMLIRLANGSSEFINAREVAPAAATPTMYSGEQVQATAAKPSIGTCCGPGTKGATYPPCTWVGHGWGRTPPSDRAGACCAGTARTHWLWARELRKLLAASCTLLHTTLTPLEVDPTYSEGSCMPLGDWQPI